jgi:hypothetical protein
MARFQIWFSPFFPGPYSVRSYAIVLWQAEANLCYLEHRFDFVSPLPWNMNSFEATNNSRYNAFYVPEVEMVIKRYRALESDPTALKRFIDQQQAITSGIMKVSSSHASLISYL